MQTHVGTLLRDLRIRPVLVDVGASGSPPSIWNEIAPHSIYVGFDPDRRAIDEQGPAGFHRSVIINEAVVPEEGAGEVPVYLTKSPYCSTMLGPNPAAAGHWLESDLFTVEKVSTVRGTTIEAALRRLELSRLDWLKLDTQGVDLRLINSLSSETLSRVLAIDTEPGLIEIYQGEDLFVDVHRDLTSKGFWLSGFHVGGFLRMRRETLDAIHRREGAIDDPFMRRSLRKTPAYLEARYLRTLEWLEQERLSEQEYTLLWLFALLDGQLGFALDVSAAFQRRFGPNGAWRTLDVATRANLAQAGREARRPGSAGRMRRRATSFARRLLG